jgi:hypothetical protein
MKWIAYMSVLVIVLSVSYSHAEVSDPGGWNKVKWGMTIKEIKEVVDNKIEPFEGFEQENSDNNTYYSYCIPEYFIDQYKFVIYFGMNGDGGLEVVQFKAITGDKGASPREFDFICDFLRKDYGDPMQKMEALKGSAKTYFWKVGETGIVLQHIDPSVLNIHDLKANFTITYMKSKRIR